MLLHRLRKKATSGIAAEVCVEAEFLAFDQDTLTLEEKVTRYFEQWRDPVHRYVVAAFGDPAEAEDITQEAFLQLYQRMHAGQPVPNVRAWVFRAAHNLAIDRIRSHQFVELLDEEGWEGLRVSAGEKLDQEAPRERRTLAE